ncbi:MAG: hypothetical protein HY917_03235 [Candidatus Diapherotrites archaeon]|nr:hypothetical protein [Candidatus Diapherotrites archaeon]
MARKEDVVRLAESLMGNQQNIRNIGIVAHIDHGKCVSGNTRLYLGSGELVEAQQLFNQSAQGKPIKAGEKELVYDISEQNILAMSFDANSRQLTHQKITHAWKLKADKPLIKLTLSTGQIIETTPEHKFYGVDPQARVIQKTAEEIRENEFILAPKFIETDSFSLTELKNALLKKLESDESFLVRLNERNALNLKLEILTYGLERLRIGVGSRLANKSFYGGVYNGHYRLQDFMKTCTILGHEPYSLIETVYARQSLQQEGKSTLELRLPQNEYDFVELAYLLGLVWGDGGKSGRQIRITNEDPEIIQSIQKICMNLFGRKIQVRKYGSKATRMDLSLGLTFVKILATAFDLPLQNKAHSISIPSLIQRSDNPLLKAFLQGYFDTDGTVEKARSAVSISSVSPKMIADVQMALLRFSCMGTLIHSRNTVYISGSNVKEFTEKIGFRLTRKQEKALELVRRAESNRNTDRLPLAGKVLHEIRMKLGVPLNHYSKTQEAVERGLQGMYYNNFRSFIDGTYSFVGNPKIKDPQAWQEVQEIEKTFLDCRTPFVTRIEKTTHESVYDFTD